MDKAAIWTLWGPLLTIAIVFAIRLRRAGRERPFDLARWWLLPALFTLLVLAILVASPPPLAGWLALAAAVVPGALLGWQRGKLTDLRLSGDGALVQRTSPLAILLLLGIVALRMAIRQLWCGNAADPHPPLAAIVVTDGLLGLALGLVVATRVELALRARALLAAHGQGR